MAVSKQAKLRQLESQRTKLQIQLTQLLVKKEMFHNPKDGSLHFYYSQKNLKHNLTRSNMQAQINNISRKIAGYTEKIEKLKN